MDYVVKRMYPGGETLPNYHLLDADERLVMVADQLVAQELDARRQVRLAEPDGRLVATIDLPRETEAPETLEEAEYPVIQDYAVYGIFMPHRPGASVRADDSIYLTVEVEGETWLVLPAREEPGCYSLYDETPSGIHTIPDVTELPLPEPVGRICYTGESYGYLVDLPPDRLDNTEVFLLSLAFLLDRLVQL
ncbi:MAG: hypothetical protein R3272_09490 [Candidatus Promineifilaceae bacterium]|nr:hypothetical protein [Candidatus Promineifilaceae bacterium]